MEKIPGPNENQQPEESEVIINQERMRRVQAQFRGLSPDASWDEINGFDSNMKKQPESIEDARKQLAIRLGLSPDASDEEIKKGLEHQE